MPRINQEEITEEQVINWLDNNEFYDHVTAETVLGRAVEKGELSYYGTKYSVIEEPVIPKWVADDIESKKKVGTRLNVAMSEFPESKLEQELGIDEHECNELYARAWLDYKVEEGPLYYALLKGHELIVNGGSKYWKLDLSNVRVFPSHRLTTNVNFLTEMSKSEWNKLGINNSNADFVKVDEEVSEVNGK